MAHELFALTALSPLDGRYAAKVAALSGHFSEYGLIRHRVRVELAWLVALGRRAGHPGVRPSRDAARAAIDAVGARVRAGRRRAREGDRARDQPRRQGGRVLAEGALRRACPRSRASAEFIHFACTSEDINNLAHAPGARAARERDRCCRHCARSPRDLRGLAHAHAAVPMLSRTHGQPATPTTLGKEMANVYARLERADRVHRARAGQGQDQRRGRQLQRARGRLSGGRLGAPRRARRRAAWASSSTRTPPRSSRTTTWRSSSTPSRAPTPC